MENQIMDITIWGPKKELEKVAPIFEAWLPGDEHDSVQDPELRQDIIRKKVYTLYVYLNSEALVYWDTYKIAFQPGDRFDEFKANHPEVPFEEARVSREPTVPLLDLRRLFEVYPKLEKIEVEYQNDDEIDDAEQYTIKKDVVSEYAVRGWIKKTPPK
jgi:hypothetical protein